MKLIVGLGNPDRKYERTYHNVGFLTIDALAKKIDAHFLKRDLDGILAETRLNGEKVILCKPLTYMNLSGVCVAKICKKFKIEPKDVFVFVDDIDLPLGKVRYRQNGSAGTHNGLKSIVQELDSTDFNRIKVGIGRDPKFEDLADFVLSKIPDENMKVLEKSFDEAVEMLLREIEK